jgi:hypothetical protein
MWDPSGHRLYYVSGLSLFAATVSLVGAPTVQGRDSLFEIGRSFYMESHARYDVSPDGKQFLTVKSSGEGQTITVVLNWMEEVRQRLKVGAQ